MPNPNCSSCGNSCGDRYPSQATSGPICDYCAEHMRMCEGCSLYIHPDNESSNHLCDDCALANEQRNRTELEQAQAARENASSTVLTGGSLRTFGIELETARCPHHERAISNHPFQAKSDGSIEGLEFVSEPLAGDNGLEAIRQFIRQLPEGWTVDRRCGYHLHIGLSDLTHSQLWRVAGAYAATEPVWRCFVPESRHGNRYCQLINWWGQRGDTMGNVVYCHGQDIRRQSFADWAHYLDRYQWANCAAFTKTDRRGRRLGTIENRWHNGTLDANRICQWVRANLYFVDWATTIDWQTLRKFTVETPSNIFRVVSANWPNNLQTYFVNRAARYGHNLSLVTSA